MRAGWLDAPQIGYFGVGMEQPLPRASFRLKQGYGAVNAGVRPTPWTRLQGEVAYEDYQTEEGLGRHPSIETLYTPATAPGLFSSPTFIRAGRNGGDRLAHLTRVFAQGRLLWRDACQFCRSDDTFTFRRLDGEIIQHLPLLRENWVLSVRGRVQSVLDDDDTVPYFLLPQLGNSRTLRGVPERSFPRSPQHPGIRGVPLGAEPPRPRHGVVL